jgi:hypothetical protein
MARVFAADSSTHATYDGTPPVTAAPFTVSAWARCTDSGTGIFRRVLSIGDKDVNNQKWDLIFTEFFGRAVRWQAETSAGAAFAFRGSWSVNAWHHVCGVEAASNSRHLYLDGSIGTSDTTSRAPSGADRISVGKPAGSSPASVEYFTGDIAEVGIWDVALTADEIASLARGVVPPLVRPASLVFYAPIVGRSTVVRDLVGGLSLTLSGTSASAHPRVRRAKPKTFAFLAPGIPPIETDLAPIGIEVAAPDPASALNQSLAPIATRAALPQPAQALDVSLSPLPLTATVIDPATSVGYNVTPDPLPLTAALPAPASVLAVGLVPIPAEAALPQPAGALSVALPVMSLAATLTAWAATLSQPLAPLPASAALPTPAVSLTQGLAPVATAAAVVVPTAALGHALSPLTVAAALPAPSVALGPILATVQAEVAVVAPVAALSQSLSPLAIRASSPTPSVGLAVSPDPLAAAVLVVAPSVALTPTLAAVRIEIALPEPTVTLEGGGAINVALDPLLLTIIVVAPTVTLSGFASIHRAVYSAAVTRGGSWETGAVLRGDWEATLTRLGGYNVSVARRADYDDEVP